MGLAGGVPRAPAALLPCSPPTTCAAPRAPLPTPMQERGSAELAQLAYDHEEALRHERLKALLEERRRLEEPAGHRGPAGAKVRAGQLGERWCAAHSWWLPAVPACCSSLLPQHRSPAVQPAGGAAASAAVAGAEGLVEKEAQRLEVMRRRQERELAQLIQVRAGGAGGRARLHAAGAWTGQPPALHPPSLSARLPSCCPAPPTAVRAEAQGDAGQGRGEGGWEGRRQRLEGAARECLHCMFVQRLPRKSQPCPACQRLPPCLLLPTERRSRSRSGVQRRRARRSWRPTPSGAPRSASARCSARRPRRSGSGRPRWEEGPCAELGSCVAGCEC